ncbi:BTB/POZ domain containing protein [Tritrichomonas foetus]|uniref:BTB/POZ domain containing protein n=1 Tax=Tritrichomonas foetus TaxID=1144522 RepID=A0A1J4JAN9_9EUKA|nr:BTB/POZ domain containing protein [Tritrichomonas foetus]|eukprot:OHS94324.1 BTB/POZ domain containing protein [Tritrichomonas foetus]
MHFLCKFYRVFCFLTIFISLFQKYLLFFKRTFFFINFNDRLGRGMDELYQIRLIKKFDEFRQRNLFIDCKLQTPEGDINAHRIVLAKNSELFKNYFCSSNEKCRIMNVPVPFNIGNLFSKMIDFFYTENFTYDNTNDDPIPFYMMAQVYGSQILTDILQDIIKRDLNTSNVLDYVSYYRTVSIDPEFVSKYPGISESFENMLSQSLQFAPFIAKHFDDFPSKLLFESLTPRLLAGTLKNTNFNDDKKVSIIDEFVNETQEPSKEDCQRLHDVINWDAEDSYNLFVNHEANWVPSETARNSISTILDHRRRTIDSMKSKLFGDLSQELDDTLGEDIDAFCNSWHLISWIRNIKNSEGNDKLHDCELIDFMSTFGGTQVEANPSLYRFITPRSSNAMQIPQYRELLYDRECYAEEDTAHYFCSFPGNDGRQFIGYEFNSACCIPTAVVYKPVKGKKFPKVVVAKAYDENNHEVYVSEETHIFNDTDEVTISMNLNIPVKTVIMEMVGPNNGGMNILRALYLNVIGIFAQR